VRTQHPFATWASILGIDLDDCSKVKVSTGSGVTYHSEWDGSLVITAAGRNVLVPRPRFAPVPFVILGRSDFFAAFRVEFDERARVTRLTAYDA